MEQKRAEAEKKLVKLKGQITFVIGDINIGANASTVAFKRYLFDHLMLPKMKLTAKEQDALDDEAIILLKEWCTSNHPELVEMFELVQEYRRCGKIKGTYIDGYLKYINSATGGSHPRIRTVRICLAPQGVPVTVPMTLESVTSSLHWKEKPYCRWTFHRLNCVWERFIVRTKKCWKHIMWVEISML